MTANNTMVDYSRSSPLRSSFVEASSVADVSIISKNQDQSGYSAVNQTQANTFEKGSLLTKAKHETLLTLVD